MAVERIGGINALQTCCPYYWRTEFPDGIRREWFEDYVQTLIARDVKNVAQIRKVAALGDIVR